MVALSIVIALPTVPTGIAFALIGVSDKFSLLLPIRVRMSDKLINGEQYRKEASD